MWNATQPAVPALSAERGELSFDRAVAPPDRERIREMWMSRLRGFNGSSLEDYLRDSVPSSRCSIRGRELTDHDLRRLCRWLFPVRRVIRRLGLDLCLILCDAHVAPLGDVCPGERGFLTSGTVLAVLAGRIAAQSRLRMSIVRQDGRLVWGEAVERAIPRRDWPYGPYGAEKRRGKIDVRGT